MNKLNYRFVKRPVEIEAFQMTAAAMGDNRDWPEWLNKAWNKAKGHQGAVWRHADGRIQIGTLEGTHTVVENAWIIRGVKGELYPCKDEIFRATYDEVTEGVSFARASGDFGHALKVLRNGGQVHRLGWNGKGLYVELHTPEAGSVISAPFLALHYPGGGCIPWVPSQTDQLATDWTE